MILGKALPFTLSSRFIEGKEEKEGNKNHRYRPTYRPKTAGRDTLWFVLDHSLVRAT